MKKKMIAQMVVFFSLIVLLTMPGCKKDSITEPKINPPAKLNWTLSPKISQTIYKGNTITFIYTSNADSVILESSSGERFKLSPSGKKTVSPSQNETYRWVFLLGKISENQEVPVVVTDVIPLPEFNFFATPSRMGPGGGDVTFNINGLTNCDSITSTDILGVHGAGSFTVKVSQTTTFSVKGWGKGGTKIKSITITVDPPLPDSTFIDYIKLHPWSMLLGAVSCSGIEGTWVPATIGQADLDTKYIFKEGGKWEATLYGAHIDGGDYSIQDSIFIGGSSDHYKIKILNSTTMVLEHLGLSVGCPDNSGYTKITYAPSKK